MNDILLYIGAAIVAVWGIAHLFPTETIVRGFGDISPDNKQLIRMEWMAEGIALIFIGAVVSLATLAGGPGNAVARIMYFASAAASLAIAILALSTGARTRIVPVKLCPVVMAATAAFILAGCLL